tara:strand:+ start:346 stop:531 length:186 start_codon:yes stop_codon:yes gene_type:complete
MKKLRPILLAGGVGSRLRPLSIKDIPLQIIEVQTGSYFREDDIIRLEDSCGRAELHRFICS